MESRYLRATYQRMIEDDQMIDRWNKAVEIASTGLPWGDPTAGRDFAEELRSKMEDEHPSVEELASWLVDLFEYDRDSAEMQAVISVIDWVTENGY